MTHIENKSHKCDICQDNDALECMALEAKEATDIGCISCVCNAEFEIATDIDDFVTIYGDTIVGVP